jgi:hypothetical protein
VDVVEVGSFRAGDAAPDLADERLELRRVAAEEEEPVATGCVDTSDLSSDGRGGADDEDVGHDGRCSTLDRGTASLAFLEPGLVPGVR